MNLKNRGVTMKTNTKELVLASILALSISQPVWAEEGVDQPFLAVENLKNKNGIAVIDASRIMGETKGILVEYPETEFLYATEGDASITINGFIGMNDTEMETRAISLDQATMTFAKANIEFKDSFTNVTNANVIGIKASGQSSVSFGNDSTLNVTGNSSFAITGVLLDNTCKLNVADNFVVTTINKGTGSTIGINAVGSGANVEAGNKFALEVWGNETAKGISGDSQGNYVKFGNEASIKVFSNNDSAVGVIFIEGGNLEALDKFSVHVHGVTEAIGLKVLEEGGFSVGENSTIAVESENGDAIGIHLEGECKFLAGKNVNIDVKSKNGTNDAYGIILDGHIEENEVNLNGGTIKAEKGNGEVGYALHMFNDNNTAEFNAGKYDIVGNILVEGEGTLRIDANGTSNIKGWMRQTDDSIIDLSLMENSKWEILGDSNVESIVNENSVIDMTADNKTFSKLMTKDLDGNNGKFIMDVDITKEHDNSDRIYVKYDFNGEQYIALNEINGRNPIGKQGDGIILATIGGGNGVFKALDGEGTLYWKQYELDHKATSDTSGHYTTDWYLKNIKIDEEKPTTTVDVILSANALNYHTWRNENDKLLKRMGELRLNGDKEVGAWFKVQGSKISRKGTFNFENKYQSYELGYDKKISETAERTRYQGVAFTYTDGNSSYKTGSGDNSSKSLSFYSTDIGAKGHYLDVVAKLSNMDNDFTVLDTNNKKISGDYNNTGVSISAEYGRKNTLQNGWYIEPQMQLTLGYFGGDNYTTSNGVKVDQSSINSAIGRLGFNIGKEVGKKSIVYAKANLLHEFGGDYDVIMREGQDKIKKSDSFNDTWFEYGIGAAFATSQTSYLYFDIERSTGSDFKKDWQWNVGARWSF